jgi:diacylglycerol kinase family enzyme
MPPKRKILILVNPFSGRRLAARNWLIAKEIIDKAYLEYKVIETERAGHAYDIVNKEL